MSQDDQYRTLTTRHEPHVENQHNRCIAEERWMSGFPHVVLLNHSSSVLDLQQRCHSENTDSLRLMRKAPACDGG